MTTADVIGVGGGDGHGTSSCSSLTNFQTIPFECSMSAGYASDDAFVRRHKNRNRITKSNRQDRVSIIIGLTIELVSGLINSCKHIGRRSIIMIYCIKYIRINLRALLDLVAAIRFREKFKAIGQTAIKVQPIMKLIKRQKALDADHRKFQSIKYDMVKAMPDEWVSFEILSQPQPGIPIAADIVFIHGLHGSSNNTWKQGEWEYKPHTHHKSITIKRHDGNSSSVKNHQYRPQPHHQQHETNTFIEEIRDSSDTTNSTNQSLINSITECWPKDWLPYDCPNVRISAINYDTDPHLWRPIWYPKRNRTDLGSRANKMIKLLVENRIGENRPIVWVGHSKGGLYVKQVIVNAYMSRMLETRHLWQSTRGVLFYSVPHSGSPLADLNLPFLTQSIEMIEIRKNFPSIMDLHRRFVTLCRNGTLNVKVFSFIEMELTQLSVLYLRIIDGISGDPGIGEVCSVPLDHFDVCKPRHRNCFLYKQLTKMINKIIANYQENKCLMN